MAHIDWCGKPCADCIDPCTLDKSIPCSPDCENLFASGLRDAPKCDHAKCDVVSHNGGMRDYEYMCCLHDTPRNFNWCEDNCERHYSCGTVAWADDVLKEKEGEHSMDEDVVNTVNIKNTVDTAQTRIVFRYMIDEVRCGGCVVATSEAEARAKVRAYYDDYFDEGYSITVWVDDEMPGDVVQVYP